MFLNITLGKPTQGRSWTETVLMVDNEVIQATGNVQSDRYLGYFNTIILPNQTYKLHRIDTNSLATLHKWLELK